jgi:hypothetical protein
MAVPGFRTSRRAEYVSAAHRRDEAVAPSPWRRVAAALALTGLAGVLVGGPSAPPADAAATGPVRIDAVIGPEHPVAPTVVDGPGGAQNQALAFDGTNYLVVWSGLGGVRAARVSRTGVLLDPQPILVAAGPADVAYPKVAFDGTNYLVVWSMTEAEPSAIRGARVSPDGAVLDPDGFLIADGPDEDVLPVVAFDGTNHLVLWISGPLGIPGASTVHATRVDTGGHVIDPTPMLIPEAHAPPSVAFDGANYLIAWSGGEQGQDGVQAIRMSPAGAVLAPGVIQVTAATLVNSPAVVFDGVHWQVAWSQWSPDGYDIHGTRVSRMGRVLDPADIAISTAPGDQMGASIARNGNHVLVAWTDAQRDGDIFGARISRPGVVLDPAGIPLATGPGIHQSPALATGTNNVMATFIGVSGDRCCMAQAVRVSRAGTVLDPVARVVSQQANSQFGPHVAFDGTNYLVVWEDDRTDESDRDIYASRVTPEGISLDPAGFFVGDPGAGSLSDVAFDGTNFIVVWDHHPRQDDFDVLGALVSPAGALLTPTPIPIAASPDHADSQAKLSPDGTNTMVVWAGPGGILASRLSPSGQVLDPGGIAVTDPEEGAFVPSVAFDGTNHLVAYTTSDPVGRNDIMARRVSAGGTVLDPTALPIAVSPTGEAFPDVAWSGRCYLVVWMNQTFDPSRRWVEAARVGTDGVVLAPGTVQVSLEDTDQEIPNVAALNGWFLVAWTSSRRQTLDWSVAAARIHENGAMPDPSGFSISADGVSPELVAGADDRWATVYWRSAGPPTAADRVFLRTVAPK